MRVEAKPTFDVQMKAVTAVLAVEKLECQAARWESRPSRSFVDRLTGEEPVVRP